MGSDPSRCAGRPNSARSVGQQRGGPMDRGLIGRRPLRIVPSEPRQRDVALGGHRGAERFDESIRGLRRSVGSVAILVPSQRDERMESTRPGWDGLRGPYSMGCREATDAAVSADPVAAVSSQTPHSATAGPQPIPVRARGAPTLRACLVLRAPPRGAPSRAHPAASRSSRRGPGVRALPA